MLWIDKHCPRKLEDLKCNPGITKTLFELTKRNDIPHIIFYGPSGAGKSTRILAILRAIFGGSIDKMKTDRYVHKDSSHEVTVCQSQHHMLIPCQDLGYKDRVIVQEVIKDLSANAGSMSFFSKGPSYRVFVLQDAETLSEVAQAGLRRTLEKYVQHARIIMSVQHLSSIILPLRSRCVCIRVPLPTLREITNVLQTISDFERLSLNAQILHDIAVHSRRNLRIAILTLEAVAMQQNAFSQKNFELPWESYVGRIAEKIIESQTPKMLRTCRDMVYDLLACCIPGQAILLTLADRLNKNSNFPKLIQPQIFHCAAHFSHTMALGSKEVWHIEAYIAQIMHQMKTAATD